MQLDLERDNEGPTSSKSQQQPQQIFGDGKYALIVVSCANSNQQLGHDGKSFMGFVCEAHRELFAPVFPHNLEDLTLWKTVLNPSDESLSSPYLSDRCLAYVALIIRLAESKVVAGAVSELYLLSVSGWIDYVATQSAEKKCGHARRLIDATTANLHRESLRLLDGDDESAFPFVGRQDAQL